MALNLGEGKKDIKNVRGKNTIHSWGARKDKYVNHGS
jgi:hypothetical protein